MKLLRYLPILILTLCLHSHSQKEGLGVGLILGEPTGLSMKTWINASTAFDFAAAWSLRSNHLYGHFDYLFHNYSITGNPSLPVFFGLGGFLVAADDPAMGGRLVGGLEYFFPEAPVDLFVELAPSVAIIPDTGFDLFGGIGMRYFF